VNAQLLVSYEPIENLFLELGFLYRKQSKPAGAFVSPDAKMFSAGVRMNIFRREYDY